MQQPKSNNENKSNKNNNELIGSLLGIYPTSLYLARHLQKSRTVKLGVGLLVDFETVHLEVYILKGVRIAADVIIARSPGGCCAALAPNRIQSDRVTAEVDVHDNVHRSEGVGKVAAGVGRHLNMGGRPGRRIRGVSQEVARLGTGGGTTKQRLRLRSIREHL